jgi:hypothetical protein
VKHKQPNSMRKAALAAAMITALGAAGVAETARATVYDFSFSGLFTMLDPSGIPLQNTSNPFYSDPTWGYGVRTQITGTVTYDTVAKTGTATIVAFDFFNGISPAVASGITLQYIGNGTCTNNDPAQGCGAGNLLLGNMLFAWSGNNGIPVSIVWDATGMLDAINTGTLQLNDIVSGSGATPASNAIKKGTLPIGAAPVATTTWNTTPTAQCTVVTPAPSLPPPDGCMTVNPSGMLPLIADTVGGSPMRDGPFANYNANFDVTSMTVTCIDGVCGPSQLSTTLPANGTANIDPSTTVTINFTQAMQASTVASAFTLSGDGGVTFVAGTMSPSSGTATSFTFTPNSPLAYSTTYTARVENTALDTLSNPFTNAPFVWTFSTKAQPVVTSCTVSPLVPQGSNFTMLTPTGIPFGGTNDVDYSWSGTFNTAVSGAGSTDFNMTIASALPHPFFGFPWTAHHIRVFGPGTWTFNTACTTTQLQAGTCAANSDPSKNITMKVGAGQIGAHMLFDWNTSSNIDVVNVWNQSAVWSDADGTGIPKNNLWVGERWAGPAGVTVNPATTWALVSTDNDNNGINGVPMIDGPFIGYNANFNLGPTDSCLTAAPTVSSASEVSKVSGGCSLSSFNVNPSERADWWLLAGFLTWLGVVRRRNKRQRQA